MHETLHQSSSTVSPFAFGQIVFLGSPISFATEDQNLKLGRIKRHVKRQLSPRDLFHPKAVNSLSRGVETCLLVAPWYSNFGATAVDYAARSNDGQRLAGRERFGSAAICTFGSMCVRSVRRKHEVHVKYKWNNAQIIHCQENYRRCQKETKSNDQ